MKKINLLIASIATVGLLASCGESTSQTPASSTPTTSQTPTTEATFGEKEAKDLVKTFDKELNTTVKVSYVNNFKLDITQNDSAKAFARDVEETVTVEADLSASNLYLYLKKDGYNKLKEQAKKVTEALVYKDGANYFYVESTMADPVQLASEDAAKEKIGELVSTLSKREDGGFELSSLLYNEVYAYEHANFLLGSSTVLPIDVADMDFTFAKNAANGLNVNASLDYIGYQGDSAIFEMGGDPAATATVSTNEKGQVTSFTETFNNANIEMPIMTPAPKLNLTGSRTLQASYGEQITKKETIEHAAVTSKVSYKSAYNGGYVEVKTCAPGGFANMVNVKSGEELTVGNWLCVKPTPVGENTIKSVTYGGVSTPLTDPANAGGWYCYTIVDSDQSINVNFEGELVAEGKGKIEVTKDANISEVSAISFDLVNGQFDTTSIRPITDGTFDIGPNRWVGLKAKLTEGYVIDQAICNYNKISEIAGYWCIKASDVGNYKASLTSKEATEAVVSVTKGEHVTAVVLKTFFVSNPQAQTEVQPGKIQVEDGMWLAVYATFDQGYELDQATANGTALQVFSGVQCLNLKAGQTFNISVTAKASA